MKLSKILVENILNEGKEVIGVLGGSFKPVTSGHFELVKKILNENPHLNKLMIYVGSGTRDNISQAESILVWEIYKKYLDSKIEIIPSSSPIISIYNLSKENPDKNIKWFLGSRENKEQDIIDFTKRTTHAHKYPNLEVINVITPSTDIDMSGTNARKSLLLGKEEFKKYLPSELSNEDKEEIYNILSKKITENGVKESSFFGRLGLKWDKFLNAIVNEKKEIQDAFNLLLSSHRGDIQLTSQQKQQIGEQMKDVLKMVGFIGILALPGGTIFLLLMKFLKLNGFIIPSSFNNKEEIKEEKQVGILYHFTSYPSFRKIMQENQLKTSSWKTYFTNEIGKTEFKQNFAISFTRDKNFNNRAYSIGGTDVRLVIDGNKLSNKYKISPIAEPDFQKSDPKGFEAEERIYFDSFQGIKDIKHYIINYDLFLDKIVEDPQSIDIEEKDEYMRNILLFDPRSRFFLKNKEISRQEAKKYLDEIFESELIGENKILNEHATYSDYIDYKQAIKDLMRFFLKLNPHLKLKSLPKIILKHGDINNASSLLGKTAYYNPNDKNITLYTEGRHPSSIINSLCHELIHYKQDMEGRLKSFNTSNVYEDNELMEIEKEAYMEGGILFRAYKDFMRKKQ